MGVNCLVSSNDPTLMALVIDSKLIEFVWLLLCSLLTQHVGHFSSRCHLVLVMGPLTECSILNDEFTSCPDYAHELAGSHSGLVNPVTSWLFDRLSLIPEQINWSIKALPVIWSWVSIVQDHLCSFPLSCWKCRVGLIRDSWSLVFSERFPRDVPYHYGSANWM